MKCFIQFISAILLTATQVYAWYKIIGNKKMKINYATVLVIIFLSIYSLINFNYINELIKPILMIIVAVVGCKILLKESISNCFVIVFCQYILVIIFEAFIIFNLLLFFNKNIDELLNNNIVSLIVNSFICILIIIILKMKFPSKLYFFIMKHTNNLRKSQTINFLLIAIVCSIIIFALTYFNDNIVLSLIINIFITLLYTIIVAVIIKTKNNYIGVSIKYNTSLDSLQAQESIISDYRMMNHENKNNLLTIKAMTKDKKVIKYIETLLNQKEVINNKIIEETLKLPEGGIRGLIYNKLICMKEDNIPYNLNVDKKINCKTLANISNEDTVDICQILGVFIDNAIDESKTLSEKFINIDLHLNNNELIIVVANNYRKNHKLNKDLKSTKGKGHGYGLKLVKRIIDYNNHLYTSSEISKELFIQKIYIKLKKLG